MHGPTLLNSPNNYLAQPLYMRFHVKSSEVTPVEGGDQ